MSQVGEGEPSREIGEEPAPQIPASSFEQFGLYTLAEILRAARLEGAESSSDGAE